MNLGDSLRQTVEAARAEDERKREIKRLKFLEDIDSLGFVMCWYVSFVVKTYQDAFYDQASLKKTSISFKLPFVIDSKLILDPTLCFRDAISPYSPSNSYPVPSPWHLWIVEFLKSHGFKGYELAQDYLTILW
jgi:hypothetical protein